jgi:DNA-binding CsgD family transcriptional regulator
VAQGKSNSEIAIIIGAREQTIKNHIYSIFTKIGVENRAAAIVHALRIPRQYIPCEIGAVANDGGVPIR